MLHVATDEDDRRVGLLHHNLKKKFGTVFNTLAAACEVSGELIAERSVPAPVPRS